MSYKPNISDTRDAPQNEFVRTLKNHGWDKSPQLLAHTCITETSFTSVLAYTDQDQQMATMIVEASDGSEEGDANVLAFGVVMACPEEYKG